MQRSSQPKNPAGLAPQPLRQEFKAPAERKALQSVEFKPVVIAKPLNPTLLSLETTREPICFPESGNWKPVLPHLWARDYRDAAERVWIHVFDNVKKTEAFLVPPREVGDGVFYASFGLLDDCLAALTRKGRLDFWEYQDGYMSLVSVMQINLSEGESIYFSKEAVPIQRLSPHHIGVLARVMASPRAAAQHKLLVIDTNDNRQEAYELPENSHLVFRPSKVSPLKHYLLAHQYDYDNVQVFEINLGWRLRWSWFADLGKMTFKLEDDQSQGALKVVSSSHIVTSAYACSEQGHVLAIHNSLFSINEEEGGLTARVIHTFKTDYPRDSGHLNKFTLFRSGCIYQPGYYRLQWLDFSDFSSYELLDADGPRSRLFGEDNFFDVSAAELATVRQIFGHVLPTPEKTILSCHEFPSPAHQLVAAQEVISCLAGEATNLPAVLGSLVAEYAFTFFAQKNANEMQGVAQRKADCAAKERKKEEERGMAPLSPRS